MKPAYGGSWVHGLIDAVAKVKNLELAVVWSQRGCSTRRSFSRDGIHYFVIPEPGRFAKTGDSWLKLDDELGLLFGWDRDKRALDEAAAAIHEYKPDLVHVFGAENRFGLIASLVEQPVVLWIQGTLDVYTRHFFGEMPYVERLFYPRLIWNYYRMLVGARRERRIYQGCSYFIGRTVWDAAHQARLRPRGRYYFVQDCLRPEFLEGPPWRLGDVRGLTIYTTTSGSLLKGTDVLIRAVALLREKYPTIQLRVAGQLEPRNLVARRLFRLVKKLGLSDNVQFLGQLDATKIVAELKQARVFVLPSFIENNPNSLAEAQAVGTPVVAVLAGGVQNLVADGQTGLLSQAGDSCLLSAQIARLLDDEELAVRLSAEAYAIAQSRHSPEKITEDLLFAYTEILQAARVAK